MSEPSSGAPIWPADWSQFIPDLLSGFIVSAIVGVAVGIALWRWQAGAEQRQEKRGAESNWAVARSELGHALSEPFTRDVEAWIFNHAAQTDDLVEAGGKLPIGQWADASPENRELVLMRLLMIDAPVLRRLAGELHSLIEDEVVARGHEHEHKRNAMEVARGATARLFKIPPHRPESAKDTVALDDVMALPAVVDLAARYLDLTERVERNYAELRESLAK